MPTTAELYRSIHFAEISELVYNKSLAIKNKLKKKGYRFGARHTEFRFFQSQKEPLKTLKSSKKQSTQAFGLANKKEIILCFRGTEPSSLADWLVNLKADQSAITVNNAQHHVFRGFWFAINQVWAQVSAWLDKMINKYPNAELHMAGHSLGGALCCMALVKLWQSNRLDKVTSIYTFGCPRNVHHDLAIELNSQCKSKVFRFVNDEDIVASLPPENKKIDLEIVNYSHFGSLVLFDQDGDAHYTDMEDRWLEVKNKVEKRSIWEKIVDHTVDIANISEPITDHFKEKYVTLCKARFEQFKPD